MTWAARLGAWAAGLAGGAWARIVGVGVIVATGLGFGLALVGAGRRAERAARLERSNEVSHDMLDAAARRPRDRGALSGRMRDGTF